MSVIIISHGDLDPRKNFSYQQQRSELNKQGGKESDANHHRDFWRSLANSSLMHSHMPTNLRNNLHNDKNKQKTGIIRDHHP